MICSNQSSLEVETSNERKGGQNKVNKPPFRSSKPTGPQYIRHKTKKSGENGQNRIGEHPPIF